MQPCTWASSRCASSSTSSRWTQVCKDWRGGWSSRWAHRAHQDSWKCTFLSMNCWYLCPISSTRFSCSAVAWSRTCTSVSKFPSEDMWAIEWHLTHRWIPCRILMCTKGRTCLFHTRWTWRLSITRSNSTWSREESRCHSIVVSTEILWFRRRKSNK